MTLEGGYGWFYALFTIIGLVAFLIFSFGMFHRRLMARKQKEEEYVQSLQEQRPDLDPCAMKITRARTILTNTHVENIADIEKNDFVISVMDVSDDYLKGLGCYEGDSNTDLDTCRLSGPEVTDTQISAHALMQTDLHSEHYFQTNKPVPSKLPRIDRSAVIDTADIKDQQQRIKPKRKKKKRIFRKPEQTNVPASTDLEIKENAKLYYSRARRSTDPLPLHVKDQPRYSIIPSDADLHNPYFTKTKAPLRQTASYDRENDKHRRRSAVTVTVMAPDPSRPRSLPVLDNVYFENSWM